MRILLDGTAVPADRGGVGRYVDELVPALLGEGADVVVACQARDAEVFAALAPRAEIALAPAAIANVPRRFAWEQTALPRLAKRVGADVLHSPHYTMPLATHVPVVVTLHDATFFSHPEVHVPAKRHFFRAATRVAVRRAAAVVVPSEATAREVRRYVAAREDLFHVAHHGVDAERFHPASDEEQARVARSLGLADQPYVGFLGTLEPRKNVPALVRGWVRAFAGRPDAPALALAGGAGWDETIDDAIAAVPGDLRVLRPGYLPLGDLPGFLAGATVLAYPSLAEGFGLPVLEAMACGATVLTTRETSLAEVGGDAVAYTATDDVSIAEALAALVADAGRRVELADAAQRRAAGFTWQASARAHLKAYEAALRTH